jgi:hypothetical protein
MATHLVKKFPIFYGTWTFITVFTGAHFWFLSWANLIQSTLISGEAYTLWRSSLFSVLHPPATSSLLGPNIVVSASLSDTRHLCFFLNVRDQVSYAYKTTVKIIVLCILICKFVDRNSFWIELTCSWFFMNAIFICYCRSQIFYFCHIFEGFISCH